MPTIIATPLLLAASIATFEGCAKESEGKYATGQAGGVLKSENMIRVLPVGKHHLLVVTPDATNPHVTTTVYVMDWGSTQRPSSLNIPEEAVSFSLEENGRDMVIRAGDPESDWRFTVRDGVVSNPAGQLFAVIGISRMTWGDGYDAEEFQPVEEGDAFTMIRNARRGDGGGGDPTNCGSGGPGSTSCSISSGSTTCSVSCTPPYYACCDMIRMECTCQQ